MGKKKTKKKTQDIYPEMVQTEVKYNKQKVKCVVAATVILVSR